MSWYNLFMKYLIAYFSTLVPLVVLDALWILGIAKNFYQKNMGFLFAEKVKYGPIFFFYPLYALALVYLCVWPAILNGSPLEAVLRGVVLGLAAYGAYDLTNHATISGWPLRMTAVDMLWGMAVSAIVSFLAYHIFAIFVK